MKQLFYLPHTALRYVVSHYMIIILKSEAKPYNNYSPFPPTPQNCIFFYPGDLMKTRKMGEEFTYLPESVIIGPQVSKVDLSMGGNHIVICVAFHPGGLHSLVKVPLFELYDQPIDADIILGKEIREINYRLKLAAGPDEMVRQIECYLLRKINNVKPDPFQLSMHALLHNKTNLTIDGAASLSCLGLRQFERKSKEVLGYSPKFFSRLIRFSKAYRLKINQPELNWGNISNQCNYFDHAHLVKDFKQFTGVTPKVLNDEVLLSGVQVQRDMKI